MPWIFFILVGGISGAFNCLSWNFFSTQASLRLAWRICSTILVAYPVMLATTKEIYIRLNSMTRDFRSKKSKIFSMEEPPNSIQSWPFYVLLNYLVFACIFSRCILFVVALYAFRSLPDDTYKEVSWSYVLPHMF